VNTKTKLVEFVHQYDKDFAVCRSSESQQDFQGLNSVPNCISNPHEIQISKLYTTKIFQLFQKELAVVRHSFQKNWNKMDLESNIWLVNFQNQKILGKRSIIRILLNLMCLVIAHYSK